MTKNLFILLVDYLYIRNFIAFSISILLHLLYNNYFNFIYKNINQYNLITNEWIEKLVLKL